MARTINEIQAAIIAEKEANATLNAALTSSSAVAIWRLWTYVVAVCMWTLEKLFDSHKAEVAALIAAEKPHTAKWYVTIAKKYQHGDSLPDGSDVYDPVSEDESVRIISHAAAVELYNLLRIKVAKNTGGTLEALSSPELAGFAAYMHRVKDAGVRLQLTSGDPDDLKLELTVYYDPLVLDNTGARLDGTATTPVKDAINNYLQNMPFNGLFVLNKLINAIEETEGVRIGTVVSAEANYAATPYVPITVEYVPDAGYMTLNETYFDANVTYLPHDPIE